MTPDLSAELVGERLVAVRARIAAAGRDPDAVRVLAVTKGFGPEAVQAAVGAGLDAVGENYAQELRAKADELDRLDPEVASRVVWHFIGQLQTNKVKLVADRVAVWHTLDRASALEAVARRAPGAVVLVQANLTDDPGRGGAALAEVPGLVSRGRALGLDVRGLMAVGPPGGPEAARPGFRAVVALADALGLPERSIGMSGDLEVAVQEGATLLRIGRDLFGPRPVRQ